MKDDERLDVVQFSALSCLANGMLLCPAGDEFDFHFMRAWNDQRLYSIYPHANLSNYQKQGQSCPHELIQQAIYGHKFTSANPNWMSIPMRENGHNVYYYCPGKFDGETNSSWLHEYQNAEDKMKWIRDTWLASTPEDFRIFEDYWKDFGKVFNTLYINSKRKSR